MSENYLGGALAVLIMTAGFGWCALSVCRWNDDWPFRNWGHQLILPCAGLLATLGLALMVAGVLK